MQVHVVFQGKTTRVGIGFSPYLSNLLGLPSGAIRNTSRGVGPVLLPDTELLFTCNLVPESVVNGKFIKLLSSSSISPSAPVYHPVTVNTLRIIEIDVIDTQLNKPELCSTYKCDYNFILHFRKVVHK